MKLDELEKRIQVMEDIEAIKQLRASYAYSTNPYNWQETLRLFTDDAVADFGPFGRYQGRKELTKYYRDTLPSAVPFQVHMNHNPIIKINGTHATGKWYWEVPATLAETNQAVWISASCYDEYVKVEGQWKFSKISTEWLYFTPYDEGWAKTKMLTP